MRELPVEYVTSMKALLGEEYEAYERSFDEPRVYGLRLNTNKYSNEDFEKICPFPIEKIPFIPNGYYYNGEDCNPAKHPYYYAGLYYLQEPSAMTPASILPIEPGDFVLDLCAAPGGKATELGSRLRGEGFLLANDISNSRAKGLLKNLELHGLHNICVSSEAPDKLLKMYPEKFNKILVDAPCSGEGMFRKDPSLIKSYEEHGPEYYSNIQKEILDCAIQLLAPGGMLLYSTCTFSELEDEDVIQYVLDQYDTMSLCRIENRFEHFCEGRKGLTDCVRLFPHKIKGEGHFLALLQKEESHKKEINHSPQGFKICKEKEVIELLSQIKRDFRDYQILEKDSLVYAIHKDLAIAPAVRFLRTGLLLGELKNGRFTPSQSLAMGLRMEDYPNCLNMNGFDDRVIRYLKGETIFLNEDEDLKNGYCLVCVDSLSLGFAKIQGKNCKNKYQAGWRWQ